MKRFSISVLLVLILLMSSITCIFAADSSKSVTNPISGDKIPITFVDQEGNLITQERLAYNQTIYIIDSDKKIKEYAVRHETTIALPDLEKEGGWIFDQWETYYKGNSFYLEANYKIKLDVYDHIGKKLTTRICKKGQNVTVYNQEELVSSNIYDKPTKIELPNPLILEGYIFSNWVLNFDSEDPEGDITIKTSYNPTSARFYVDRDQVFINGASFHVTFLSGVISALLIAVAVFVYMRIRKKRLAPSHKPAIQIASSTEPKASVKKKGKKGSSKR